MAQWEIGYFGDERLQKGARICCVGLRHDRRSPSASSRMTAPNRSASGAFSAMPG
jgi:hypothetical protein